MDLYVLDDNMRKIELIDNYQSLIWTDRWYSIGDFELDIASTTTNRGLLTKNTMLAIRDSYHVMIIEDLEDTKDDDGVQMLKVTGRSLEKIFEDRVARAATTTLTANPTWDFNDLPQNIVKTLFDTVCITGGQSARDIIPWCDPALILQNDILFPTTKITTSISPDTLDTAFQNICSVYNIGYRLIRPYDIMGQDDPVLEFDIYSGNDYSSSGTNDSKIVFSPDLDSLENTTEYSSVNGEKNVAYVITPNGHLVVYGVTTPHDISGFARKVLYVDASDITETDATLLPGLMTQRGQEELAKTGAQYAFDGDLKSTVGLRYMYDYDLGDRVDLRNTDGVVSMMRVSEHIFASDDQGDRSYPTLTVETVIEPDAWAGSTDEHWADATVDETWTTA